jgi:N-acylneuraminate cytidylyltransferase
VNITAFIPVKGNSSRLPGKNILPFGDSNLLTHKIRQLQKVKQVTEIFVSSDSDEMLEIAEADGVTAVKRPADLSDESRPFGDLVEYAVTNIKGDHLMWTPVTSPIVDEGDYTALIDRYYSNFTEDYDSLTTVTKFKHFLLDDAGPLNFAPDKALTNSQDIPTWYMCTFGCSVISAELAVKYRYIFGNKPFRYVVSPYKGLDIDTPFDYLVTKLLWEYNNAKS